MRERLPVRVASRTIPCFAKDRQRSEMLEIRVATTNRYRQNSTVLHYNRRKEAKEESVFHSLQSLDNSVALKYVARRVYNRYIIGI